jgi:hypothetical protein
MRLRSDEPDECRAHLHGVSPVFRLFVDRAITGKWLREIHPALLHQAGPG